MSRNLTSVQYPAPHTSVTIIKNEGGAEDADERCNPSEEAGVWTYPGTGGGPAWRDCAGGE